MAKRTKNLVLFTQGLLDLSDAIKLERQQSVVCYWAYQSPIERQVTGFKFGFVITKLK